MRALVLEKFNGPFVAKDVPTPAIAPHEALVRVRNVGVCGTDVKIRANRMGLGVIPLIMGHEIAGDITEYKSDKYQNNRDIQPSLLFKELNPEDDRDDPQLRFEFGTERSHK